MNESQKNIYLDHAATTPLDPQVFDTMKPYFTELFHNPGGLYLASVKTKKAIEDSRKKVAEIVHARAQEIIFVDGGTEANNLAIIGAIVAWQKEYPNKRPHIISSNIEHSSVLSVCEYLSSFCDMSILEVDIEGKIDQKELKESIHERTVIVAIAYANGEIGSIENVKETAKIIRRYRKQTSSSYPYFHVDAVQAVNYLSINVLQLGMDTMTISGSKIYGPKKIASLFIKKGTRISPIIIGGDQEFGLRAGTENIPSIVGFAKALELSEEYKNQEFQRLLVLKKYFIDSIKDIDGLSFNSLDDGLPHIINISLKNVSSEELLIRLDTKGIACSMKSACKSDEEGNSHVILALRKNKEQEQIRDAYGSIRFSMGRGTSKEDLDYVIETLKNIVFELRESARRFSQ